MYGKNAILALNAHAVKLVIKGKPYSVSYNYEYLRVKDGRGTNVLTVDSVGYKQFSIGGKTLDQTEGVAVLEEFGLPENIVREVFRTGSRA